jgi:hypothetical protein
MSTCDPLEAKLMAADDSGERVATSIPFSSCLDIRSPYLVGVSFAETSIGGLSCHEGRFSV